MLKYAIIGFGGLGRVHLSNLNRLSKEGYDLNLVAICGTTAEKFKESVSLNLGDVDCSDIDISNCSFYDDYKELIDKENPDFIVSAVPTYLHKEVAVYALSHGINVFSEKPMALNVESCEEMIKASKNNNAFLMIGQCLRFDSAFVKLKEYVENTTFGRVSRAEFTRYSQTPLWTWNNWILKEDKSGGCIIDMHIHDVDLINWIFGTPKSIHSVMTENKVEAEAIFTQYEMKDGTLILSSADWSMPQKFPFEAKCLVNFEKATVVIKDNSVVVYTDNEVIEETFDGESYFYNEMKDFVECITKKCTSETTSTESILDTVKIVMAEVKSAKEKNTIYINMEEEK